MTDQEIIEIYKSHSALLKGHFLLSSGMHSDTYLQSALVMQYPFMAEQLLEELAKKIYFYDFSTVLSPAIGGIRVGYEIARILRKRSIYAERVNGEMQLRRGFKIFEGERIMVMEDVLTTGKSVNEVLNIVKAQGAKPVLVSALIDRSPGAVSFDIPFIPLLKLNVLTYSPNECPLCKQDLPLVSPGSRHKKSD